MTNNDLSNMFPQSLNYSNINSNGNVLAKIGSLALFFGTLCSNVSIYENVNFPTTNSITVLSTFDGTFSYLGTFSNKKTSYMERYLNISKSDWFLNAYKNKSLGYILEIED